MEWVEHSEAISFLNYTWLQSSNHSHLLNRNDKCLFKRSHRLRYLIIHNLSTILMYGTNKILHTSCTVFRNLWDSPWTLLGVSVRAIIEWRYEVDITNAGPLLCLLWISTLDHSSYMPRTLHPWTITMMNEEFQRENGSLTELIIPSSTQTAHSSYTSETLLAVSVKNRQTLIGTHIPIQNLYVSGDSKYNQASQNILFGI